MQALGELYTVLGITGGLRFEEENYRRLYEELVDHLNRLIDRNFNTLVALLYRIDVSQEKVKKVIAAKKDDASYGQVLAPLILNRQIDKIKTRRAYAQKRNDTD